MYRGAAEEDQQGHELVRGSFYKADVKSSLYIGKGILPGLRLLYRNFDHAA